VTPFGEIVATPERGLVFGNRGVLQDREGCLVRDWQVRRWIACRLAFKGRRMPIFVPNSFTRLFFLDEATAFAAGHRPCAECRFAEYQDFRSRWGRAGRPARRPGADELDKALHAERLRADGSRRTHRERVADLPDGAMIADRERRAWLLHGGRLLLWTPGGYTERRAAPAAATRVVVLTPRSVVGVLRAGYVAGVHPTAAGSGVSVPATRGPDP
jgi:hypothetical protein